MGVDPAIRNFLRNRYHKAWISSKIFSKTLSSANINENLKNNNYIRIPTLNQTTSSSSSSSTLTSIRQEWEFYPRNLSVCFFDAMGKFKVCPKDVTNGIEYLNYLVKEMNAFFRIPTSEAFFFVLDRGSPCNKSKEQSNRYKKCLPLQYNEQTIFIDDFNILLSSPDQEDVWKSFSVNKILNQELRHYITEKLIALNNGWKGRNKGGEGAGEGEEYQPETKNNKNGYSDYYYTPPIGKTLLFFGGQKDKPTYPRANRMIQSVDEHLYYVENVRDLNNSTQPYVRQCGIYQMPEFYNVEEQKQLLEGESSVLYFSKPYTNIGKSILILSSDGDLIFQLLLQCKDRLDMEGKFKNEVFLRLIGTGIKKNEEQFEDVNINSLYEMMIRDPIFQNNGITNPELFYSFVSVLMKNDFFSGFANGIGNMKDESNKNMEIPIVLKTLFDNFGKLKGLIQYIVPDSDDNVRFSFFEKIPIIIDEDLFASYTYLVYITKWWKYTESSEKKSKLNYKSLEDPNFRNNIDNIKNIIPRITKYLYQRTNYEKIKVLSKDEIKTFSRMTEWVLNYNMNNYRKDCSIVSPISMYEDKPYYGWIICSETHTCKQGQYVSPKKKPIDSYDWFSVSKKTLLNFYSYNDKFNLHLNNNGDMKKENLSFSASLSSTSSSSSSSSNIINNRYVNNDDSENESEDCGNEDDDELILFDRMMGSIVVDSREHENNENVTSNFQTSKNFNNEIIRNHFSFIFH